MRLQNVVMQLRKACSHPYLFQWPTDSTGESVADETLVTTSGKMMILDQLLEELFRRKHKVLVFSQFTTMLDIIAMRALRTVVKVWCAACGGALVAICVNLVRQAKKK